MRSNDIFAGVDTFAAKSGRSVAIKALKGASFSRQCNSEELCPAASVLKIPLVLAVLDAARRQEVNLETSVARSELGITAYPSIIDAFDVSRALSLGELCRLTLATSDNLAAQHLVQLLGFDALDDALLRYGMVDTTFDLGFRDEDLPLLRHHNFTTAQDIMRLLTHLAGVHPSGKQVLRMLANGLFKNRIGLRLPDDISVANKTGSLNGVANDVGIVSDGRVAVAFVFLSHQESDVARASLDIGDVTELVWRGLGGRELERTK